MKNKSLAQIREFYTRTAIDGEAASSAYKDVFGLKSASSTEIAKLRESDEYNMVAHAVDQVIMARLKNEVEAVQRKKVRMYSSLLDKGQELIDAAESTDEQLAAQKNQRENLNVEFFDAFSENRNTNPSKDFSDVLDGIIID